MLIGDGAEKFQKQDTVGAFMTSQCDLELACRAHLKRSEEGNHKFYGNCKDSRWPYTDHHALQKDLICESTPIHVFFFFIFWYESYLIIS